MRLGVEGKEDAALKGPRYILFLQVEQRWIRLHFR
jgi:hypothetical protein